MLAESNTRNEPDNCLALDNAMGHNVTMTTTTFGRMQQTTNSIQYLTESVEEREFENPIYGDNRMHTAHVDYQDEETIPDHEFDNPIYGTENDLNTYTD